MAGFELKAERPKRKERYKIKALSLMLSALCDKKALSFLLLALT
jgi:hypothetical protein